MQTELDRMIYFSALSAVFLQNILCLETVVSQQNAFIFTFSIMHAGEKKPYRCVRDSLKEAFDCVAKL